MLEKWKTIAEFPKYQISNLGRVKSTKRSVECILNQYMDRYGYMYVRIFNTEHKCVNKKVHRLVAQAFLSNYSPTLQVNHINEIKTDNSVSNLEMCTNKYNCNYGSRKTALAKPVEQYSLTGKFIKLWESSREIERQLGFAHACINACCRGKIKSKGKYVSISQAYNYIWKYKN